MDRLLELGSSLGLSEALVRAHREVLTRLYVGDGAHRLEAIYESLIAGPLATWSAYSNAHVEHGCDGFIELLFPDTKRETLVSAYGVIYYIRGAGTARTIREQSFVILNKLSLLKHNILSSGEYITGIMPTAEGLAVNIGLKLGNSDNIKVQLRSIFITWQLMEEL